MALSMKIKGSIQGTGMKAKGIVSIDLQDIGLVPSNYVQFY